MSFLADQLSDYPRVHSGRANLLIHIVAVPLFNLAMIAAVTSVPRRAWRGMAGGLVIAAAAFAAEGRGHALEQNAPVPFGGPFDAVKRIFAEQFITFPRFVLSGGWARAYRAAASRSARGLPDQGDR